MSKILIIDDSKHIHSLIRAGFANESLYFHSAYDGAEGLRAVQELHPDLILLDHNMPETTGVEVCRRLSSTSATSRIPIIFLTGADAITDKIIGLNAGAADYMTKPFDLGELRARVRAALRQSRPSQVTGAGMAAARAAA